MRTQIKRSVLLPSFTCDVLVMPFFEDLRMTSGIRSIDQAIKRQINAVLQQQDFTGKNGQTLLIPAPTAIDAKRILLWGLGDKNAIARQNWVDACRALANATQKFSCAHIGIVADIKMPRAIPLDWALQQTVVELVRSTYRYTDTKSSDKNKKQTANKISLLNAPEKTNAGKSASDGCAIGQGINLTRNLGNLPGNVCTPKYLSSEARKLGRKYTAVSTKVLGEKQMRELGMGSLLSVGHGSDQESQLIIMNYSGGKKSAKPHVLVGKGITFDTGGISLKPGGKMDEMKFDMCGGASVFGVIQAIANMKLPLNVIGVVAAAENMPSGSATKPGDVVTSMAGKTIEVLNTDAEGRLVLCDALHYVKRFKPASVVDIATLTGACIVALGHHATGLLSNDDRLADELLEAGTQSGDRAWRLPLWDEYQKQLRSPFADLANIGGPSAGTVTAACFLSQFAKDYRWAHLDIAGTAWNQGGGKGASGRPVSLLCKYLMNLAAK